MTQVQAMRGSQIRIAISLATLVAWMAVNLLGTKLFYPPENSLDELVTTGINWPILLACVLLIMVMLWRRWTDLCFRAPEPGTLKLLLFPGILVLLVLALAAMSGLPPVGVIILVGVNTLLVGFSEETMFRGILYRALRGPLDVWPAILVTTAAFGSVHILNGFTTGDFASAITQATTAACTGLLLIAILLRTGSLWAAIIFHALWDWATFLVVLAAKNANQPSAVDAASAAPQGTLIQTIAPFAMILPGTLYALWLLRRVHRIRPSEEH